MNKHKEAFIKTGVSLLLLLFLLLGADFLSRAGWGKGIIYQPLGLAVIFVLLLVHDVAWNWIKGRWPDNDEEGA